MLNGSSVKVTFSYHTCTAIYQCSQHMPSYVCVRAWSLLGYVTNKDIKAAATLPEVAGDEEELGEDWDNIL